MQQLCFLRPSSPTRGSSAGVENMHALMKKVSVLFWSQDSAITIELMYFSQSADTEYIFEQKVHLKSVSMLQESNP